MQKFKLIRILIIEISESMARHPADNYGFGPLPKHFGHPCCVTKTNNRSTPVHVKVL